MSIQFPTSPDANEHFQPVPGGYTYIWDLERWVKYAGTALESNIVVNPSAIISQQNGSAASAANPADYFVADCWPARINLMGTKSLVFQRLARNCPNGAQYSLSWKWTAVGGTLDDNCFAFYIQQIEGNRCTRLAWGTSYAIPAVLRFGLCPSSNAAQVIYVFIRNSSSSHCWVHQVDIPAGSAGKELEYTVSIPACTVGTWLIDNGIGLMLGFTPVGGNLRITPTPDAWVAGNYQRTAGASVPAVNDVIEIFEVGLYADPKSTGAAPIFQGNHFEDDLMICQRYWYRCWMMRGVVQTATTALMEGVHPVPMRVAPTMAVVGSPRLFDESVAPVITSTANNGPDPINIYTVSTAAAGGMTAGRPAMHLVDGGSYPGYIAVSARF